MHQHVPEPVIDAFLSLLAEKSWEEISLPDIAGRAGISLADLRDAADGKLAIFAAFQRRIDRAVLEGVEPGDGGGDSGRDRLFDLAMRRFDALAFYKPAIRHLAASAARDGALALALNAMALPSARYMLAASGLSTDGLRGIARAQGFALILARVGQVWLDDADPDQGRTMAALDRALERAEGWDRRAGRVVGRLCRVAARFERRRPRPAAPAAAAPADEVA